MSKGVKENQLVQNVTEEKYANILKENNNVKNAKEYHFAYTANENKIAKFVVGLLCVNLICVKLIKIPNTKVIVCLAL